MKVLLYSLLVIHLNSCTPKYLRKVTVLDEGGRPLKGVDRTPRTLIFDKGVTSNRRGKIYILKGGYGALMKEGYIPLLIKKGSDADTYTLYRDLTGKIWNLSDLDDIVPSQ